MVYDYGYSYSDDDINLMHLLERMVMATCTRNNGK